MTLQIGRFVRGCLDEDTDDPERAAELDMVFDRDRLAEALKRVEADTREVGMSQPERLTAAEWDALVAASAQLEVDWREDGTPDDRRRYAALERARAKIRRVMGPADLLAESSGT